MDELKMLTVEEVADLLGMRVNHVHDLRKIGVLEPIRTGRCHMFSRASIMEFQELYKGKDVSNVKNAVIEMNEVNEARQKKSLAATSDS